METEKINRISELTKLSKQRALTALEQAEREALRREYIDGFRQSMEHTLQNVMLREEDGILTPLRKKTDTPT